MTLKHDDMILFAVPFEGIGLFLDFPAHHVLFTMQRPEPGRFNILP